MKLIISLFAPLFVVPLLVPAQTIRRVTSGVGASAKPDYKECYQVIRADSVRLFYDADYLLTPPACASIRRLTRISSDGNFTGEVRDYWMDENILALRVRYRDGKADGLIEQFAHTGKRTLRGQLTQGLPTGEWQYWYDDGQPWQVLRFPAEGGFRIVAYWDSTGARRAVDGNGYWEGAPPPNYVMYGNSAWTREQTYFRFRGPVEQGLPHGRWQSVDTRTKKPFSDENFVHGRFRSGQLSQKPLYGSTAMASPKVVLEAEAPTTPAEQFRLGLACAARARETEIRTDAEQLVMPKHALGLEGYGERLHLRLQAYGTQPWYISIKDRTPVVCGLDSTGQVSTVLANSPALQAAVREAVKSMPQWTAATVRGHYTLCGFVAQVERDGIRVTPMASTGRLPLTPETVRAYWEAVLAREMGK